MLEDLEPDPAVPVEGPRQVPVLRDLAGRLIQRASGYVATIVAGEPILEAGEATGALPGRLVRATDNSLR